MNFWHFLKCTLPLHVLEKQWTLLEPEMHFSIIREQLLPWITCEVSICRQLNDHCQDKRHVCYLSESLIQMLYDSVSSLADINNRSGTCERHMKRCNCQNMLLDVVSGKHKSPVMSLSLRLNTSQVENDHTCSVGYSISIFVCWISLKRTSRLCLCKSNDGCG